MNGFFLFCFCFKSLANLFAGRGEFDLKIFPRSWRFWYDLIRAFAKSPYLSHAGPGGGNGGFQLTSALETIPVFLFVLV